MFGIGPMELMLILVVALLVFGPKRVPELARTLGRGLAEFRRASSDLRQSLALDELQRDLRRDPSENQTIHRPGDRPAQTGDDVATPAEKDPAGVPMSDADGREDREADSEESANQNSPVDSEPGNVTVAGASDTDPRRG